MWTLNWTTIQDPLSKELYELDEDRTLQLSSGHQLTGSTPELHCAAWRGDLERVKFLMDNMHQNPLQKDTYGDAVLHAAAWGGSLHILKYLIDDKNCNPSCLGRHGRTPLHVATKHDHLDVVKYLVTEQQVEPLCQDENKWTPLHISCVTGSLSIVKLLRRLRSTNQSRTSCLLWQQTRSTLPYTMLQGVVTLI